MSKMLTQIIIEYSEYTLIASLSYCYDDLRINKLLLMLFYLYICKFLTYYQLGLY